MKKIILIGLIALFWASNVMLGQNHKHFTPLVSEGTTIICAQDSVFSCASEVSEWHSAHKDSVISTEKRTFLYVLPPHIKKLPRGYEGFSCEDIDNVMRKNGSIRTVIWKNGLVYVRTYTKDQTSDSVSYESMWAALSGVVFIAILFLLVSKLVDPKMIIWKGIHEFVLWLGQQKIQSVWCGDGTGALILLGYSILTPIIGVIIVGIVNVLLFDNKLLVDSGTVIVGVFLYTVFIVAAAFAAAKIVWYMSIQWKKRHDVRTV